MPERPVGQLVELARHAEALGYERIWIPDEGLAGRDCYVTLAAIAAATTRVRIGTGITNAYTRHPGVTAAAIASLDELSGGRAMLGLGAGGGLTLDPLAIERLAPLAAIEDLVTAARHLWAGERVDHAGGTGPFNDARLEFGRADIPIWLAGRGPRIMRLAGQLADGFVLSFVHKELLGRHAQAIRAAAEATGRPRPRLAYVTMIATTETDLRAARESMTFRLVDSPASVKERIGLTEAGTSALRQAIADGGPAAAAPLVRPGWVDPFVIAGTPAECASEIAALMAAAEIDEFQISVNRFGDGADQLAATAALLASLPR